MTSRALGFTSAGDTAGDDESFAASGPGSDSRSESEE